MRLMVDRTWNFGWQDHEHVSEIPAAFLEIDACARTSLTNKSLRLSFGNASILTREE